MTLTAKPHSVVDCQRQLWTARLSADGKVLVAGGYDARLHRWDLAGEKPQELTALEGHNGWLTCLAYHGERLFSADSWGRLSMWSASALDSAAKPESAKPAWSLPQALAGWVRAISVSPDGQLIAAAGNDTSVKIFHTADGKLAYELPGHADDVFSVAFHPAGKAIVTGDLKGKVRHFDVADNKPKLARELSAAALYKVDRLQDCGGVRCLAFDADGKRLAAGGMKAPGGGFAVGGPTVLVFDWEAGKQLEEVTHGDSGFVYETVFHNGVWMAVSCEMPGKGFLWFWKPGETKPYFVDPKLRNCRSVSVHGEGKRLAVVVSQSQNGNGRGSKGEYPDGKSQIQLLELVEEQPPEKKDGEKKEAEKK